MNLNLRAFVCIEQPGDDCCAGRSLRSLDVAGVAATELRCPSAADLRDIFRTEGSVLFLQAGAWLVNSQEFRVPHPSATGKPLCAVGATRTPAEFDPARERCAASWNAFFSRSGG